MRAEACPLSRLEGRATSLVSVVLHSSHLAHLDMRGSLSLETIQCAAPPAFVDVHNCAALRVVDLHRRSALHGAGSGATVVIGGCSNLSPATTASLRRWASVLEQ